MQRSMPLHLNFKTLSYQPKSELFMFPLGAAMVLLTGYHILMLIVSLLLRLFTRRQQQSDEVVTSSIFKVHV
jgi:Ca-activated chloride channel family protein